MVAEGACTSKRFGHAGNNFHPRWIREVVLVDDQRAVAIEEEGPAGGFDVQGSAVIHVGDKLLRRDGRGADLAHDDAGRGIRKLRRGFQGCARRERKDEGGE